MHNREQEKEKFEEQQNEGTSPYQFHDNAANYSDFTNLPPIGKRKVTKKLFPPK
jgi:hypothetical protein